MSTHPDMTPENLRIAARVMRALSKEVSAQYQETSLLYQLLHSNPECICTGMATALEDRAFCILSQVEPGQEAQP